MSSVKPKQAGQWYETEVYKGQPVGPLAREVFKEVELETARKITMRSSVEDPSEANRLLQAKLDAYFDPTVKPVELRADWSVGSEIEAIGEASDLAQAFAKLKTSSALAAAFRGQAGGVVVYQSIVDLEHYMFAGVQRSGYATPYAVAFDLVATPRGNDIELVLRKTDHRAGASYDRYVHQSTFLDQRHSDSFFGFLAGRLNTAEVAKEFQGLSPSSLAQSLKQLVRDGMPTITREVGRAG